jgi:predicted O-methyltransferase YrrM
MTNAAAGSARSPLPAKRRARRIAGRAVRRARAAWEAVQPFPTPHYPAVTPTIGGDNILDPYLPPTSQTLAAAATSEQAATESLAILGRLSPSDFHMGQQIFMEWGRSKYGSHWRLANLLTTVWAAATLIDIKHYLEIGVQRGRSASIVGALRPHCAIYGFDLWIPDYAGTPNPGPDFVRGELRRAGHQGDVTLVSGDSRKTLPAFLRDHPGLYFDLITIDGDKSIAGIASDFANALPRLKAGGIVVFDDMPAKPVLRRVWDRDVRHDRRYADWEFESGDHGVAAAIRLRDQPS